MWSSHPPFPPCFVFRDILDALVLEKVAEEPWSKTAYPLVCVTQKGSTREERVCVVCAMRI